MPAGQKPLFKKTTCAEPGKLAILTFSNGNLPFCLSFACNYCQAVRFCPLARIVCKPTTPSYLISSCF
jgi:hypothetical protein